MTPQASAEPGPQENRTGLPAPQQPQSAVDAGWQSLEILLKRWKVERTFAWLQNFRRLLVRQDRMISVYEGFFHLDCAPIYLRW
jgi:transposase